MAGRIATVKKVTRELVTSTSGERISLFKVGTAIAILVGSWIMVHETINGRMNWQYFVVYLFTIGGFTQLGAFMSRYYGGASTTPVDPQVIPSMATQVDTGKCPDCPSVKPAVSVVVEGQG
jgi:hypothetical protein